MTNEAPSLPVITDPATYQAEIAKLRVREKAHTHEGDAIAADRRRLPMIEVDATLTLTGPGGPLTLLDAFEGRQQLIAYYFMWQPGAPAAEQCEGCTWCASQVGELSYLHSRGITYAPFVCSPRLPRRLAPPSSGPPVVCPTRPPRRTHPRKRFLSRSSLLTKEISSAGARQRTQQLCGLRLCGGSGAGWCCGGRFGRDVVVGWGVRALACGQACAGLAGVCRSGPGRGAGDGV